MQELEWAILGLACLCVCAMIQRAIWNHGPQSRKPQPRPQPRPEPEVQNVQHVTPRRPVICSIELSAQQVFDAIADGAMERSGRDDLDGLHWDITLYYTENKVKLKGAVVEFQDRDIKKRGRLWLVKG